MSRLKAVILDWAGTTVDYGSRAPTSVFMQIFAGRECPITEAEARAPMGLAKREHIATIANMPRVRELWQTRHGSPPTDHDVDAMYADFLPLQKEVLAQHSHVIPGVSEAIAACRDRGLKIGSSTGYTQELMEIVAPLAAQEGYAPDALVCSDEVTAGRPAPWMNFRAAELLGVFPMSDVLVVDDTAVGIEAGRNAGSITVAVTQTGNALGLSQDQVDALPAEELASRLSKIEDQFREAGAHHLLKTVADLPRLLDQFV